MRKNRNFDPQFIGMLSILDTAEAASYLRLSTSTLAKLRCRGGGPEFVRQSARKVLYLRAHLDAWLAARRVGGADA